jgi:4-hydroxybenzoate polyprenyltransferase
VARADKPLATGELSVTSVRTACGLAVLLTVLLSLACGALAGLVHLGCVAAGWAYNLGLKSTVLSWLPYAVAFGGIPVFVSLAAPGGGLPLAEVPAAGALLGIGAHLVNVLPDLRDDAATGVRGLPHRLGEWRTRLLAVVVLVAATALLAIGASSPVLLPIVVVVAALAAVALVGRGAAPFRAAVGIAAADVLLLVLR